MRIQHNTISAWACIVALFAVVSNNAFADVIVGTGISISIPGVGDANADGYEVSKDAQNSYYLKKGTHTIKPQKGDDIKYKDAAGNIITVFQPEENLQATTEKVHNYKDSLFTSLTPVSANIGDFLWPLMVSDSLRDEYLSLIPPAFGDNFVSEVGFFGVGGSSTELLLLGSSTSDWLTPMVFSLDVGLEGLDFSFSNAFNSPLATVVSDANFIPTASFNNVILTTVPEPTTMGLFAIGLAGLLGLSRSRRADS